MRERVFTIVVAILLATAVAYTQPVGTGNPPIVHTDVTIRNLNISGIPPNNCLETSPGSSLVVGVGKPCGQPAGTGFNVVHQGFGISLTGTSADPIVNLATPVALPTTSVTPGSYTNTNLTVGADGRLTAASTGSAVGATVPAGLSGQIVGYGISGIPQSFNVSGDGSFNASYALLVQRINGIIPGNLCSPNQWVNQISSSAVGTCSQPSFTNISGTIAPAQLPVAIAAGTCVNCSLSIDQYGRVTVFGSNVANAIASAMPACNATSIDLTIDVTDCTSCTFGGPLCTGGGHLIPICRHVCSGVSGAWVIQ